MKRGDNTKKTQREINKEELRRYLSERGKVSHIFDTIEKLEDLTLEMDSPTVSRLNSAINARLSLLKKYLPDEKSVEIKNAEGEEFKTSAKMQIVFNPVGKDD